MPLREDDRLADEFACRLTPADGVAGDQEDVVLDPVAEKGVPVGREEVTSVAAQLEEGERVAAV